MIVDYRPDTKDIELFESLQIYTVLCGMLERSPFRRYTSNTLEILQTRNLIMGYQVMNRDAPRTGDDVLWLSNTTPVIGKMVDYGVRKGEVVMQVKSKDSNFLVDLDPSQVLKLTMPKNGKIYVKYRHTIRRLARTGNAESYKHYNLLAMPETRREWWAKLFAREGVSVTLRESMFNRQVQVVILG